MSEVMSSLLRTFFGPSSDPLRTLFGPSSDPGAANYGSNPARRAATTASSRVCAPSFRIAERR